MITLLKHDQGTASSARARGKLVAQFLARSLQCSPDPEISVEELTVIASLLLRSGAGALGWWLIRNSNLRATPLAQEFLHDYRFHALQAALKERGLKQIIRVLRGCGVDPVLVKGWAIARHYPETGLRQYGDFDLCVRPEHFEVAKSALGSFESQGYNVDLHLGFGKFFDLRTDAIFARSQLVRLDDLEVRVLSAEDHLRFLCIHLLRHGVVRPLWLCDIAVLLKTQSEDFDWDKCLGHSRQHADWVACAVGLAHQLLGVEVEGTPILRRAQKLPRWLVPAVLKAWGTPYRPLGLVAICLRQPMTRFRGLLKELPRHWPNPIEATMTLRGPFNELPRLPFQVGHVFSRAAALLAQLAGLAGLAHLRSY